MRCLVRHRCDIRGVREEPSFKLQQRSNRKCRPICHSSRSRRRDGVTWNELLTDSLRLESSRTNARCTCLVNDASRLRHTTTWPPAALIKNLISSSLVRVNQFAWFIHFITQSMHTHELCTDSMHGFVYDGNEVFTARLFMKVIGRQSEGSII